METAAFVSLAVLAAASLVQAVALAAIGFALARSTRRVDEAVVSLIESWMPAWMRVGRTLADVDEVARLAALDAARTRAALEATRAHAEEATHHAVRDSHDMALSLRALADVTRSVEQGLEAYREARPAAARPWHRAIDAGLATYRSAKLQQPAESAAVR